MSKKTDKRTIMVSSTVYGIEELLDRAYVLAHGLSATRSGCPTKAPFAVRSDRSAFSELSRRG
jgi:hypothetical protein